jgi:hypothetical protein
MQPAPTRNNDFGSGVAVPAVKLTLSIAKSHAPLFADVIYTVVSPLPGKEKLAAPRAPADGNDFVIESPMLSETV